MKKNKLSYWQLQLVKVKISCIQSWTMQCEGLLGYAEKGAGVTGSFPELQGARNIMYKPRGDTPGISFVRDEWCTSLSNKL